MATVTDPNDLGTDVALLTGLAPVWGLASGKLNLAYAIVRRLQTPRGGLFPDPDYGYDVVAWLNASLAIGPTGSAQLASLQAGISAEVLKDPRVQSVDVELNYAFATKLLTITLTLDTAEGPFDLVLSASSVTVALLAVDGVTFAAPAPTADNTTVIVGAPGPAGPAGPAGATGGGGGGSASLLLDDSRLLASSSGAEEVLFQWDGADFGALPAGSLTAEMTASVFSASGTATFRLRLGGSDGVADGTVLATITHALASYQAKSATGTFTNPTGLLFVKITAQSSGAAIDARAKGPTVTFR
jgi:hypothetical protein